MGLKLETQDAPVEMLVIDHVEHPTEPGQHEPVRPASRVALPESDAAIRQSIHRQPDWPKFRWDPKALAKPLVSVRHQQGRLMGHVDALGFPLQQEAVLQTLTEDVLKSSDIEGETLDAATCGLRWRAVSA